MFLRSSPSCSAAKDIRMVGRWDSNRHLLARPLQAISRAKNSIKPNLFLSIRMGYGDLLQRKNLFVAVARFEPTTVHNGDHVSKAECSSCRAASPIQRSERRG